MTDDTQITITDNGSEEEVSLMDIANIDMESIEEFEGGFEPTPKGLYVFKCTDAELTTIDAKNGPTAAIKFAMEIAQVVALVDDTIAPEAWIGKTHQETIFVIEYKKSVGQAKAIMRNAGFQGKGTLQELLDAFVGCMFSAPITQRKDKNDPDRIYANLAIGKIKPMEPVAATQGTSRL